MTTLWHTILAVATRAPSPHNIQPWRLRIHDATTATVYFERRLMLPYTDTTGAFMLSAMGSILEAIRLVAANHGHALDTTLLPPAEDLAREPFAMLRLRPAETTREYPDAQFFQRRTTRVPLFAEPVAPTAICALRSVAAAGGACYTHVDDPARVRDLLALNADTMIHDMNDPGYHGELAPYLRIRASRSGLEWRTMATSRAELLAARMAPGMLQAPLVGGVLRRRYAKTLGTAPAIGAIGGPFWERDAAVQAGRMLLRFWLECAGHGLGIHPLGNLITNQHARSSVARALGRDDSWLVFKIGRAPLAPLSQRYALHEILV